MLLPGSAGGVRGIGGDVEGNADPLLWHGCDSREEGSLSAPPLQLAGHLRVQHWSLAPCVMWHAFTSRHGVACKVGISAQRNGVCITVTLLAGKCFVHQKCVSVWWRRVHLVQTMSTFKLYSVTNYIHKYCFYYQHKSKTLFSWRKLREKSHFLKSQS